jgi:hypothetical protein
VFEFNQVTARKKNFSREGMSEYGSRQTGAEGYICQIPMKVPSLGATRSRNISKPRVGKLGIGSVIYGSWMAPQRVLTWIT